MSQELEHESARSGDLVAHDNGSIFWKSVHHMSWIDDDGNRQFAPMAKVLLTTDEQAELTRLAAAVDGKENG